MSIEDRLRDEVQALQASLERIDVTARLEELRERVRSLGSPAAPGQDASAGSDGVSEAAGAQANAEGQPEVESPTRPSQVSSEPGYRSSTVCKLIGISYRQLNYWARTHLVKPSVQATDASGSQWLYSFTDLVELRIIKRLLDAGVSLQRIRDAIGYLRREAAGKPLTDITLISDGKGIYACHSGEEVIDVLSAGQAVFGIRIRQVWADTEGDLAHLPSENLPPASGRRAGADSAVAETTMLPTRAASSGKQR